MKCLASAFWTNCNFLTVLFQTCEEGEMVMSLCVAVFVLNRNYSVVNVEKGQVEVKRMSCPGSRISCQMKMSNTLWMATEVHNTT